MKKKKVGEKITETCTNNHINYWSDLFIVTMVLGWSITVIVMIIFAIYSTIVYADNSIWCELGTLVAVPLSCGGAIWMIKNSVQHAIANQQGHEATPDFPAVDASEEINGKEEAMFSTSTETAGADEPDDPPEGTEDVG